MMENHLFRFGETHYKQSEGGSIGSILTGEVSKARMILYMRKLKEKCEMLGLKMYLVKVFVDDVFVLIKFPGRGFVVREECLVWENEQEQQDVDVEPDVITARLLVKIANEIQGESDIQMTYDMPSQNTSRMMPVLDLQVWCEDDYVLFKF